MENTQYNSSNQDSDNNQRKRRKGPRSDFGRPVYWKPNFNGPKDKDGYILMTQQKTYAGLCKREARKFARESKNNNDNVVGTKEYTQNKIKEIGDLVTK